MTNIPVSASADPKTATPATPHQQNQTNQPQKPAEKTSDKPGEQQK